MNSLSINLPGREYKIDIGIEIIGKCLPEVIQNLNTDHVVVVTNTTLQKFYPNYIFNVLKNSGVLVSSYVLPDGEEYKNLETLTMIFDFLMEVNANRETVLIAFGGGVIGDITGFAASTFLRGVPFIQIPTTLLSDVDSSVGGKTAVNHPLGKNSIGSFKQPEYVCIDLIFLKTLPLRELKSGYIELLKHGLINDANFFKSSLNQSIEKFDFNCLEKTIFNSCEIKARVVELDETEKGLRANLNFGHTLGHLIETHSGYGKYLHGEAVGAGMCFAAFVSWRWNELPESDWEHIRISLGKILTPIKLSKIDYQTFKNLLLHDKKSKKHAVNFIMLKKLGVSFIRSETSVNSLWDEFIQFTKKFPEIIEIV